MKHLFLIVLFACISISAFAQRESEYDAGYDTTLPFYYNPFELGVVFSGNVDYRFLIVDEEAGSNYPAGWIEDRKYQRMEREIPRFGYNVAVKTTINVNHYFGIEVGLQHARVSYRYKYRTPSNVIYIGDPERLTDYRHIVKHVGVPVGLKMGFGTGKVRFTVANGVELNYTYYAKQRNIYTIDNNLSRMETIDLKGNSSGNVTVYGSLGVDYYFLRNLRVNASPIFRYSIIKIHEDQTISSHPWSAGLSLGIHYGF